jgi:hypothetical protein
MAVSPSDSISSQFFQLSDAFLGKPKRKVDCYITRKKQFSRFEVRLSIVTHICNPSYLGSGDW